MFKMAIEVLTSKSFKNQQIIIENKFYLLGYKRCKWQLHAFWRFHLAFVLLEGLNFKNWIGREPLLLCMYDDCRILLILDVQRAELLAHKGSSLCFKYEILLLFVTCFSNGMFLHLLFKFSILESIL